MKRSFALGGMLAESLLGSKLAAVPQLLQQFSLLHLHPLLRLVCPAMMQHVLNGHFISVSVGL